MRATYETKREGYLKLGWGLDREFESYRPHYQELADHFIPSRPRHLNMGADETNRGDKRNQKILDATGTLALRVGQAGMMSGVTSRARPWIMMTTQDPALAEIPDVQEWLDEVTKRILAIYARSNIYDALQEGYADALVFGTAAIMIEEDAAQTIHATCFPPGSYRIAHDSRRRVNVFFRRFRMTVRQIVDTFLRRPDGSIDWSKASEHLKDLWEDQHNTEAWIDVCHVIAPNEEYERGKPGPKGKLFTSCYFEQGGSDTTGTQSYFGKDEDVYLRESGYDYFPVTCLRWSLSGNDVYATACPGMDSLGDVKQLQHIARRAGHLLDKQTNPPMKGPRSLQNEPHGILPGNMTYVDVMSGGQTYEPAHVVDPRFDHLVAMRADIRSNVDRSFLRDVFQMLQLLETSRQMTATEVDERRNEKLMAMVAVYERLDQDWLGPQIDITFRIALAMGLIPPWPEELDGADLKVEYISIMAQAQKALGLAGLERSAGFAVKLASDTEDPSRLDTLDLDEITREHARGCAVPARCIRDPKDVEQIRADRARQQQAMQASEVVKNATAAAKDLATSPMDTDNALTRVVDRVNEEQELEASIA